MPMAMIDDFAARYELLLVANEEACGLNEVIGSFIIAFPDDFIEERLRAAKQAVRDLASRGWLRLWFASWTSPDREDAIAPSFIDSVLDNPYWWEAHLDRMVWLVTTDAGREAFAEPESDLRNLLANPPAPK